MQARRRGRRNDTGGGARYRDHGVGHGTQPAQGRAGGHRVGPVAGGYGRAGAGGWWAQMGTIGVEATEQAAERLENDRPGVLFVDAPVSGSKGPAEQGQLL